MIYGGNNIFEDIDNMHKRIYITRLTLPSDVKAQAWGTVPPTPGVAFKNLCGFNPKISIKPGETITFDVPSGFDDHAENVVYGLKFMKA
jgi:hypothetical protein